jgi:Protein of unknown function (DUF3501)
VKPVTLDEILSFIDYARIRSRLRPLFILEKERRRLAVGEHITLLFENGRTVWYQVQEMLRTEQIVTREAIQHELDTYNELQPAPGELGATMMIEFGEARERDVALRELLGLERHVWIRVGDQREQARFDTRQMSPERISSVQFVRFPLPQLDVKTFVAMAKEGMAAIEVDHPALTVRALISGDLASALAEDLEVT